MLSSGKGSEKNYRSDPVEYTGMVRRLKGISRRKCRVSAYVRQMEKTPRLSVLMGTKEIGSEIIDPRYDAELG